MRRLVLAMMVVSAYSLADVTFGLQETDDPKGKEVSAVALRGHLESTSVCSVRCEVSSTGEGGILIRQIVPEGTLVKKGDLLVAFETRGLEDQEVRQQMACKISEAGVIKFQSEYEVAVIEKEAFVEGTFKIAKLEAELAIFVLTEALRRAEEELEFIAKSAETGQVPRRELEATKFAVAKARMELDLAQTRLEVLIKYTFVMTLQRLESQIKTAEARLKAEEHGCRIGLERLDRIKSQIENCAVKAPMAGRVIYAGSIGASPRTANQGARVRQGQPILSIRDPGKMQIKVWSYDPKASQIEQGIRATIRVDAFPDMQLNGAVAKIVKLPAGNNPMYDSRKPRHEITVSIENPPEAARAGLTAEVTIDVGKGQ